MLDLRAQPEPDSAVSELDHRAWHVGVPPLVQTHAVPVREAKELGDAVSVDEIFGVNVRDHAASLPS